MFCRRSTTRALVPTWTRCGCRVRLQASLYRLRPTYAAASRGRTASRTATRSRSFSPRISADSAAAPPAARKDRPRVVSPRSASRTWSPPVVGGLRLRLAGVVRRALLAFGRQREPVHEVGDDRVGGTPGQLCLRGR